MRALLVRATHDSERHVVTGRREPRCNAALLLAMLPLLVLTGCGYGDSLQAHEAQISMIGMSSNDLQACAGPPDKVATLNAHTQIYTYLYKPLPSGGFNLDLPLSMGGVKLGGSGGYCNANLRVVDGRVTELHYTGDDDLTVGTDGVCEPLIRGCMRQPEPTMKAGTADAHASAFHAPPVPPQPAIAEQTQPATATAK